MKRFLFILLSWFVLLFCFPKAVFSWNNQSLEIHTKGISSPMLIVSDKSATLIAKEINFLAYKKTDKEPRVEKLKEFLQIYGSPLSVHAEYLISISDKYNIPWSLIPAIAGVESTFCKNIRKNSFNCWGWNNGRTRFQNYNSAIDVIAKSMKEKYFDRGLVTPKLIGPIYAPPTRSWPEDVRYFMHRIENYIPRTNTLALQIAL